MRNDDGPEICFSDPTPTPEEFSSGLAVAQRIGDATHLIWYVDQVEPNETGGGIGARVSHRMVIPNSAIEAIVRMLEASRCAPPIVTARDKVRRRRH